MGLFLALLHFQSNDGDGSAAGKTAVVAALSFMKAAVLGGSLPQGAIRDCCRCGKGHKDEETVFDIQFQIDGQANQIAP